MPHVVLCAAAERAGPVLVILFAVLSICGPVLAPEAPGTLHPGQAYHAPSALHPLGTTENGMDLLSALLHGARTAGKTVAAVLLVIVPVGTLLGMVAGYCRGCIDHAIGFTADVVQAFPVLLLQASLLALIDQPSFGHLVLALALPGWVIFARLVRAETLGLANQGFVDAARALGLPTHIVLWRHVLPNLQRPVRVQASLTAGSILIAEATLSFLGLGPSEQSSWGQLLEQGTAMALLAPHVLLSTATAVGATVLGLNLSGDARMRGSHRT